MRADLFAGPDKIVSASNTYGLIRLTIHEAKVQEERRYCAVISIGMQVRSAVWMHGLQQYLSLYHALQTYMSKTEPKMTINPQFDEGEHTYAVSCNQNTCTISKTGLMD